MGVFFAFHVSRKGMSHEKVFTDGIYTVKVTQPGKGVPAVVGRVLCSGSSIQDPQRGQHRIKVLVPKDTG